MFQILTFNRIATRGLETFPPDRYQVDHGITAPDAILLRSHPLAKDVLAPHLQAIARAGVGVNNVPVAECTELGIVVFNTPGANANSVKELVVAALLNASRNIVQGTNFVQGLAKDLDAGALKEVIEQSKKRFKGREIAHRTLGVIGLGAIGSQVAETGMKLGMRTLGYDPGLSVDGAWRLSSAIEKMPSLRALLQQADYVSLHVPLLDSTRGMIGADSLQACKTGAILLNYAREEIVDQQALVAALDAGRLAAYHADFPAPELLGRADCLLTPHLGASTREAEEQCAIMAARQTLDFLEHGNIRNSVNFPELLLEPGNNHRLALIHDNVPAMLGQILARLARQKINVADMLNKSRERLAYTLIDLDSPVTDEQLWELQAIPGIRRARRVPGNAQQAANAA